MFWCSPQLALSSIQEKANIEIGNAQRILSIKDAELHAAEESLLGLKEVTFLLLPRNLSCFMLVSHLVDQSFVKTV